MGLSHIHSTRVIGLKYFFFFYIFTSIVYFGFCFPEIFVSTYAESQNTTKEYKRHGTSSYAFDDFSCNACLMPSRLIPELLVPIS